MNNVLITGGLGYIGSKASILAKNNINFFILDILSNCKIGVIERLGKIIKEKIEIFVNDYHTEDGNCVRDYIYIMNLANAHFRSIQFLEKSRGYKVFNIVTGNNHSLLELIDTFEDVSGLEVPKCFVKRRDGDANSCYADPTKDREILGWQSEFDLR